MSSSTIQQFGTHDNRELRRAIDRLRAIVKGNEPLTTDLEYVLNELHDHLTAGSCTSCEVELTCNVCNTPACDYCDDYDD